MRRLLPHILVTTPESLYILLTLASGRELSGTVRTVILDESHALASNKRGCPLGLIPGTAEGPHRTAAAYRDLRDPGLRHGHGPLSPRYTGDQERGRLVCMYGQDARAPICGCPARNS